MSESLSAFKDVVQAAVRYWAYYKWTGPQNIRGYELHRIRADLMMACAIYNVEKRKQKVEGRPYPTLE